MKNDVKNVEKCVKNDENTREKWRKMLDWKQDPMWDVGSKLWRIFWHKIGVWLIGGVDKKLERVYFIKCSGIHGKNEIQQDYIPHNDLWDFPKPLWPQFWGTMNLDKPRRSEMEFYHILNKPKMMVGWWALGASQESQRVLNHDKNHWLTGHPGIPTYIWVTEGYRIHVLYKWDVHVNSCWVILSLVHLHYCNSFKNPYQPSRGTKPWFHHFVQYGSTMGYHTVPICSNGPTKFANCQCVTSFVEPSPFALAM